jgi:hypothetical protein
MNITAKAPKSIVFTKHGVCRLTNPFNVDKIEQGNTESQYV